MWLKKSIHSQDYLYLLSLLKRQRKNLGMLQESLSFQLGKASSFVSKVERAERRLDTLELIYYTQALHLDPKKFICDFIDTLNLVEDRFHST